jgi:hypothetical protein
MFQTKGTKCKWEQYIWVGHSKKRIAGLRLLSRCNVAWQPSAWGPQTVRSPYLCHTTAPHTQADECWSFRCSDCRIMMTYTHTTPRIVPTCNISLSCLTLPEPEATGTLWNYFWCKQVRDWHYGSLWSLGSLCRYNSFFFVTFGPMWRWRERVTPWTIYPSDNSPPYPLDRILGGDWSCSGHRREEKTFRHW